MIYGDVRVIGRTLEGLRDTMLIRDKIMSGYKRGLEGRREYKFICKSNVNDVTNDNDVTNVNDVTQESFLSDSDM